jgi:hypothetical protein
MAVGDGVDVAVGGGSGVFVGVAAFTGVAVASGVGDGAAQAVVAARISSAARVIFRVIFKTESCMARLLSRTEYARCNALCEVRLHLAFSYSSTS